MINKAYIATPVGDDNILVARTKFLQSRPVALKIEECCRCCCDGTCKITGGPCWVYQWKVWVWWGLEQLLCILDWNFIFCLLNKGCKVNNQQDSDNQNNDKDNRWSQTATWNIDGVVNIDAFNHLRIEATIPAKMTIETPFPYPYP